MGNSIYLQRTAGRSCSASPATRLGESPTTGPSAPSPSSPAPAVPPPIAAPAATTADRDDIWDEHTTSPFASHKLRARRAELTLPPREAATDLRSRELTGGH